MLKFLLNENVQAAICCIGCMYIYGEGKSPLGSAVWYLINLL